MLGFVVTTANGPTRKFEATTYTVGDRGELTIYLDQTVVEKLRAEDWIEVRNVGTPLTDVWPAPTIESLLDTLSRFLTVTWGHNLYLSPADVEGGRFNELDTLTAAVAKNAGIDATEGTYRMLREEVRRRITSHFEEGGTTP